MGPVDAAIAAASAPAPPRLEEFPVTIASTGRLAVVVLPPDATDGELAELAGWLLTAVLGVMRQRRTGPAAARILVPR